MNNFKKVGLTALAGSLAAVSANAAEMSVSGASVLTYTTNDTTEVTGNPYGMKTNLGFTASGDVNGMTVSYMQTSKDQFAGMSSARLSIDMGDLGTLAFDQGSGSGLATIDDKTPTAAEEIWDNVDTDGSSGANGLVGAAGSSGVLNYIKAMGGVTLNAAARKGSGAKSSDGGVSGAGQSAWDFALTGDASSIGIDGLAWGAGYGEAENGAQTVTAAHDENGDDEHMTGFANYTMGSFTFGYQVSHIKKGASGSADQNVDAWGLAFNVNENLSISYGERDVEFDNPSAANITEKGEGIAVAYTMGSMKIAGNMNEVKDNDNSSADSAKDKNTEIAVSFAF
jgi:outer membrane protein OmpU